MTFVSDGSSYTHNQSIRRQLSLNQGWEFRRDGGIRNEDSGSDWREVNLPHYGRLEAYDVSIHFQGFCWYRKEITPTPEMIGRRVVVEFEAGMQTAELWVNGALRERHEGGYLPFFADITEQMWLGISAVVEVRLDNRDQPDVPPGKPLAGLDFCYFSGLYRNVWLHITDPVHITNACIVQKPAGGGIFVRFENVSESSADVVVDVDVVNEGPVSASSTVDLALYDGAGVEVARTNSGIETLACGASQVFKLSLAVARPLLWSPSKPYLYSLVATVNVDGELKDSLAERIGIRTLFNDSKRGFFLNGNFIQPFGANRHQAFPYIGNAASDNAQYRDAVKLKEAGFDIVRLAHYPQSPAFLDACDELGLLTIICIPGWQHFSDTEQFRGNVILDMRQTIRRDRNHACAVLWETSLNETLGFDDILIKLIEVAHEEYPGSQMLTCGDTESHDLQHVSFDVPYSGWDGTTRTRPNLAGKMSLHREYGDNQFGGFSRYTRGDGELLMLVQAWNFQTAVNDHLALDYTWGQCTWEAFDNNRGMSPDIATCGVMDPFRLPKFMYYFYKSQRDAKPVLDSDFSGPTIFIASYWQSPQQRSVPLVVFSNCDEVEVIVNGTSSGRRTPDDGPNTPFGDLSGFDLNYWKLGDSVPIDERKSEVDSPIFTGGNCRNLKHPPFTFSEIGYEPGEVVAIGYIDGVEAVRTAQKTAGKPHAIELSADLSRKPLVADGADTIFVYAAVVDEEGIAVPYYSDPITFDIDGPAELIGDNPRAAEAGIATVLLRAGMKPAELTITATATGLTAAILTVQQQNMSHIL